MANLNFSFTFKGGKFCLCCTVKGTTIRHYKEVSGSYKLSNPDFERWNRKEQKFLDPTPEAIANNGQLGGACRTALKLLLNNYKIVAERLQSGCASIETLCSIEGFSECKDNIRKQGFASFLTVFSKEAMATVA